MLSYCLKCRKNTKIKNPKVIKTKNERIFFLSKYAVCDSTKSKFIKVQEDRGFLSKLTGTRALILSGLPIANILF